MRTVGRASVVASAMRRREPTPPGWEDFPCSPDRLSPGSCSRPLRFYVARATYVGLLFVLMWTAWQVLIGFREVREFGVIARFGGLLFQIFVFVQLTLMLFFAPLAA